MFKKIFYIVISASFLLGPSIVSAQEEIILNDGRYDVVISQVPEIIEEDGSADFTLQMKNLQGNLVVQTQAWIDIEHNGRKIFASPDFRSVDGLIEFSNTFDGPGQYTFKIRMINTRTTEEANVAYIFDVGETSGNLSLTSDKEDRNFALISLIIGVIVGSALTAGFRKRGELKEEK